MTRAAAASRRVQRVAVLAVGLALLASCASPPRFARAERTGDAVSFSWSEFEPGPGAEGLTYELCVWSAQMGLPRDETFRVADLTETRYEKTGLPLGVEQVWSVRARFRRDGQPCASNWYAPTPAAASPLVPLRGLPEVPSR
jgi:hypothetical protein